MRSKGRLLNVMQALLYAMQRVNNTGATTAQNNTTKETNGAMLIIIRAPCNRFVSSVIPNRCIETRGSEKAGIQINNAAMDKANNLLALLPCAISKAQLQRAHFAI